MLIVDTTKPVGMWTGGENNRFLTTFLTPLLYSEINGFSVGMVIVPPHANAGLHSHALAQEVWYVLEGCGKVRIGEETRYIKPGDLIYGPAGVPHALINDRGDADLKALLMLCPGGDEKNILDRLGAEALRACLKEGGCNQ